MCVMARWVTQHTGMIWYQVNKSNMHWKKTEIRVPTSVQCKSMFTQQKYHRLMQGIMLKRIYKCMKRLKSFNLRFDRIKIWSIHIKTKCLTGVKGDSRWPKYHPNITQRSPGYTYPPKILCAAFQMQYHKPNGLWTPKEWNNTLRILDDWLNEWKHISLFKAVSQLNVYHFYSKMIIMKIMRIMIKIIMKNELNENNKLNNYVWLDHS